MTMGMLNPVPIYPFIISTVLLSPNITYLRIFNPSSTTGVNSGAGTAYPSGVPEITTLPHILSGDRFVKLIDYTFDVLMR